jgi:hypothetical protein
MFCPNCSERQANDATQFCSKCGFPTVGVKKLLENDGSINGENQIATSRKGIKQGVKLIILSLILFPAFVLLNSMFPPNDVLVESSPSNTWFEQIGWTILWTLFLAGAARIAFTLVFERQLKKSEIPVKNIKEIKSNESRNALPPSESIPASEFGKWKTTGDLYEPIFARRKTSGDLR